MQPKSEWAKHVHDVFLMGGLDKGTIIESIRTDEVPQVTDAAWTALEAFSQSPEQLCIQAETVSELHCALQAIPKQESTYLLYRFGFPDESKNKTRKETAEHFYLTTSRAAAIENAALKYLRSALPW